MRQRFCGAVKFMFPSKRGIEGGEESLGTQAMREALTRSGGFSQEHLNGARPLLVSLLGRGAWRGPRLESRSGSLVRPPSGARPRAGDRRQETTATARKALPAPSAGHPAARAGAAATARDAPSEDFQGCF